MHLFSPSAYADSATRILRVSLVVASGLAICILAARLITDASIEGDARQTLQMALNMQHHGVISLDKQAPFTPTMYREPLPVLLTAVSVGMVDRAVGEAPDNEYSEGHRIRFLKRQDLLWLMLVYLGTFLAIGLFSSSFALRFAGAVFVCTPYLIPSTEAVNSLNYLYSDIAASAVLVLASVVLVLAARHHKIWLSALAGISFAMLALIKAAFLYISVGVLAVLGIYYVLERRRIALGWAALQGVVMSLAFLAATFPWMYRNYQQFGFYQIAERGGEVLLVRAFKDLMTPQEYLGSFYAWGPAHSTVGALLGFSEKDLNRGGRLQRLNRANKSDFNLDDRAAERAGQPGKAISFFRKSRAERVKLLKEYTAAGYPPSAVDKELQRRAIEIIREHPFRHLALTIPLLWRGACFTFPVLAAGLVYSLRKRRYDLALFVMPAFGSIMFYALLTHFIPRYGMPTVPVATVLTIVLVKTLWDARQDRRSQSGPIANPQ